MRLGNPVSPFWTKSPAKAERMIGLRHGNRNPCKPKSTHTPTPQDLHHKAMTYTASLTLLPAHALPVLPALQRRLGHRSLFGKQVRPPQSPSDPRSSSVRFRLPLTSTQQTDMSRDYKEVSTMDAAPQVLKVTTPASRWTRQDLDLLGHWDAPFSGGGGLQVSVADR